MEVFHCLILLKLVAHIAAIKSKSVNLALETVLEFNNKDKGADVKFLDNVQQFIDKIKMVMSTNRTARRFDTESKNMKFTEFIKSAIDTLKTYDDDDLEDLFAVLNDEIRKYHYKGCKFYELVEDQKVRRFVANKLDDIKEKPATKLRKNLNDAIQVIEDSKLSRKQTEFFDYVNSIYGQESSNKLKTFLNNLQTYSSKSKRANLNLVKVVQDGLRSVIFDHYSALNPNARRDLKIKLETSWRSVKFPERVERNVWTVRYTMKNGDRNKYNQYNARTKDFKEKLPTNTVKLKPRDAEGSVFSEMTDGEEKLQTTPLLLNKSKHTQHKDFTDVYFNNENIEKDDEKYAIENELTSRPIELKWSNSVESLSSEALDIEDKITTHYKHKRRPKKYRYENPQRNSKEKYVSPQKLRLPHKKTYSFVTLYPEEITFNTQKRFKIGSTTRKSRVYTLWEEKITSNDEKPLKLKASKSKIKLRTNMDKHRVIADSDAVIDVRRAVSSSAEDGSNRRSRLETNSEKKPIKHRTWHQTKTTKSKYRPRTFKKVRKHMPEATTPEEGISIESYGTNRWSMNNQNINDTSTQIELKHNVLKRINNLEWHQTKTTKSKYRPTTFKKFRKHMPEATNPEEGISIESYGTNKQSMNNQNINDTSTQIELKRNVLKRINNLEWHQTKTTKSKYRPTTFKKFRKHMPEATTPKEGISIESYGTNRRSMNNQNINDTSTQIELKRTVLNRINNLEKQMEEVKSKIETTKLTTDRATDRATNRVTDRATDTVRVTEFEPLDFWTSNTAFTITHDSTSSTTASITTSSTTTFAENVAQLETENNAIIQTIQSISNETINTDIANQIDTNFTKDTEEKILIDIQKDKTLDDVHKPQNVSIPKPKKHILTSLGEDVNNDIGNDKDLDNIMQKYNISPKPEKIKPFDFGKFLAESEVPGADPGKVEEVKNRIEKDMKKLLEEREKNPKELSDPFHDLNTALDLMRR